MSTSPAGGKTGILVIPKGRNLGFDSPCHGACSVQSQRHRVSIIVTTACWANKGEGGTGDTQIDPPSEAGAGHAGLVARSGISALAMSDYSCQDRTGEFFRVALAMRLLRLRIIIRVAFPAAHKCGTQPAHRQAGRPGFIGARAECN